MEISHPPVYPDAISPNPESLSKAKDKEDPLFIYYTYSVK